MRICLSLQSTKNEVLTLPIHYNRLIQGAIYENISKDLSSFLHDRGFASGERRFKMFTFSRLSGTYQIDHVNKKILFPKGARLVISSPIKEFCTSLMGCILGDAIIRLGSVHVQVEGINAVKPEVYGASVLVNLLSPVVTYSTFEKMGGGKYTCYFQPGEQEFARQLEENLRKKYTAYYGRAAPGGEVAIKPLNRPKQNITMYKQTVIKGYSCRLKLAGPVELLQLAVDAGLGAKNSQGFGCVEIEQNTNY